MKTRTLQFLLVMLLVCPARIAFAAGGDDADKADPSATADKSSAADKSKDLAAEVEALKAQVAQLAKQAQASQDYIAICNLQTAYGYYVDKAKWDEVSDLFTKDATLEIGLRGVYKGQDRVRAYMHSLPDLKYGSVFNHMQLQPKVDIDPDGVTAHGRWRAIIQVGQLNGRAQWGEATYENVYAKEDGVWKIKKLHAYFTYYIDFYKGWDKGGDPPPGPIAGLPPDEPTTEVYKMYPDVYVPPYHYKNPVTGK
ncbi:MAG TPA: nuclear transport factor 2 family protein [Candidatus Acidoferrum sp.]|nr:nuclear transport factor 2 family protein [Candidatus Acidoferrum sp.]